MLDFHHLAHSAGAYASQLVCTCTAMLLAAVTIEHAEHLSFTISLHGTRHTVCHTLSLFLVAFLTNKLH